MRTALWIVGLGLSSWFMLFGLSDWMNPGGAIEYYDRNPIRPLFTIAFGVIITMVTLSSAMFVTATMKSRR